MISVKLFKVQSSVEALNALASKPLPALCSFRVSKVLKWASDELKSFDEERIKKAKELGVLSEDGQKYDIPEENRPKFVAELESILSAEVECPGDQFKLSDFGDVSIEPKHFSSLDWLIGW